MLILQGAKERVEYVRFSPDGTSLVVPCRKGLQVWRDVLGGPPDLIAEPGIRSVHFLDDGRILLSGLEVFIYAPETGLTPVTYPPPYPTETAVAVSPDGKSFISAQWSTLEGSRGRLIRRTVADPARDLWAVSLDRYFRSPPMFLRNRKEFAIIEWWNGATGVEYGPAFVVRDVKTGRLKSEIRATGQGHSYPYSYADISPDRLRVAARTDRWIGVYRTEKFGTSPVIVQNDTPKVFTGIAFHPSGRYLAATSNDKTVKLYDTATWAVARTFAWGIGRLRSVAFSPDGTRAAVGSDTGKVLVWDVDV